jgi:hypothetical protein
MMSIRALVVVASAEHRFAGLTELRDLVVIVAAPHDDLLRRFVADLRRRGLPASRLPHPSQPGSLRGPARAAVVPGDPDPVAAYAGCTP